MDERASSAPRGPTSQDLIHGLQIGDDACFEALVRQQGPRLLGAARRILRDEEDARDAVQEAFLSAFRSIGDFAEHSQIGTWLHRICVNACLMKLRGRRRKPETSIEDLLPRFLEDGHHETIPCEWKPADELLMQREVRDLVRESMALLPESHRTVLLLRDIEDLTTEETATALGVTTTVVKVRLHRARQALRALLENAFSRSDA